VERAQFVIASVESKFGNRNIFWQSAVRVVPDDDHKARCCAGSKSIYYYHNKMRFRYEIMQESSQVRGCYATIVIRNHHHGGGGER
jgi:hypothetical protein